MKENLQNIGIWGQRHYEYLMNNQRTTINVMRMNGTLHDYLSDINHDAQEMFDTIVKRTAELENVTEQLKATNQAEWIARMNSIRKRAEEFVLNDLIYQ